MNSFFWIIILLILLSGTAQCITFSVTNYTGAAVTAAPVRGGIPFAKGALKACTGGKLTDSKGRELPCSVRTAAKWYDGSIKWLGIDTQITLPAKATVQLTFVPAEKSKQPKRAVSIKQDQAALTVETGPAKFVFSKKQFGLPSEVWVDLNKDGKWDTKAASGGSTFAAEIEHTAPGEPEEENWLRDSAGSKPELFTAASSGDYKVEIESSNSLHAVVKLSGWLVNADNRRIIQYFIRAHAYAGSTKLDITHTFVYAGKPKSDFIRSMWIKFPQSSYQKYTVGTSKPCSGKLQQGKTISLTEIGPEKFYHMVPYTVDKSVSYSLKLGDNEIDTGKEATGWVSLGSSSSGLNFAMRDFWKMHPKELQCTTSGLTVYLWPKSGGKVLDLRRRYDYVEDKYHYDLSLWPYGGEGVGVTHQMSISYTAAGVQSAAGLRSLLDAPLILQCSPEYYAKTGVFGDFAVASPDKYPLLEGLLQVDMEWLRRNRSIFHWDGMIDYGDNLFHGYEIPSHYGYLNAKSWNSRGYVGWQCNDGTLAQSLFLQYIRTGDYQTYLAAESLCRHVTEIDTCHYCAQEPLQVGGGHRHDQQHWGNGVRGYGTATHGAITYYLLTGDERVLDVAKEYAKYHAEGEVSENEDRIGGLIRLWEITGDPLLKAKADQIMAEELVTKPGSSWPFLTDAHFRFVSNTSQSLLFYLSCTPEKDHLKLKEALIKAADSLEAEAISSWGQINYLPTIVAALAYQITGESKYINILNALLQRLTVPRNFAVPENYTQNLRAMDFEELVATAQKWNVNNVYTATIHDFVPLPYAIAALQKAGVSEEAVFQMPRPEVRPEPFEEVIPPSSMASNGGVGYIASLQHGSPSDERGGHSELILLENGVELGPSNTSHTEIRKEGRGRWSHWGARTIYFSTSDNTDPRTNGREYRVRYRG